MSRSPDCDDDARPLSADPSETRNAILWHPSAQGGPIEPSVGPLPLTVRQAGLRDVPRLARVPVVLRLNQPDINLWPYRPPIEAMRSVVPLRRPRTRFMVACAGGRLVAFAHWQPVLPDRRWQLLAMGSATGVYDAEPVWEELLRQSITAAGLRGVKRLYARVPVGSPAGEPLRKLGFAAFASETVFLARRLRSNPVALPMRRQELADTWAIHQLYSASVPKQVQYAEAWTSHRWETKSGAGRGVATVGWLVEEGHQLLAYARVSSRGGTHTLELIYAPEHVALIPDVLDGVIARVRAQEPVNRVFCTLRGYQVEAVDALCERGFDPVLEQDLLVKYTTVTSRTVPSEAVPFHVDVIERLPKRVPSFLHGRPGDGMTRP